MPDSDQALLIGCGVVGNAIAMEHLRWGVSICVADIDEDSIQTLVKDATNRFAARIGRPTRWSSLQTVTLTLPSDTTAPLNLAKQPRNLIIIESVAEQLAIKQKLFSQIEKEISDNAILCSNTSTIPIRRIAEPLHAPERICGLHFFMPVEHRGAVEIIKSTQTDPKVIQRVQRHATTIGKKPLVAKDTPGFVVNRLLSPYLNESLLLLGEGVSAAQLQQCAIEYGMPMSPLQLLDTIGLTTGFDAGRYFWQCFPERISPSPILARLVKIQRSINQRLQLLDSPASQSKLSTIAAEAVDRYQISAPPVATQDIIDRLMAVMAIEADIMLDQQIVSEREVLNQAMIGGLGFSTKLRWSDVVSSLTNERKRSLSNRFGERSAALKF